MRYVGLCFLGPGSWAYAATLGAMEAVDFYTDLLHVQRGGSLLRSVLRAWVAVLQGGTGFLSIGDRARGLCIER